jgi:putative PIG3 family NAD(P)H quinone oxidoreductase
MRAVVISRPGGPEVLELRDVPRPEPADHELLVRVRAAGINRADLLQRAGRYPAPPGSPADIPGLEFAGEVAGAGRGASRWSIGDRVFGIVGGGAQAEYLVVHEDAVAAVPDALSWTEAGAVPEVFITAHDAMIVQACLRANERVLIHAAGSAVGLAAIQLARTSGAIPYGTARTADKIERARALGLEDGLVVGEQPEVIVEASRRWSSGAGIDVILDLVGGPYTAASVQAAAPHGRIMLIGTMGGATATIPLSLMLRNRITIRGTALRGRSLSEKIEATAMFARDVVPLFAARRLRSVVDSVYSLADVARAHEQVEGNATFGKVVLAI